MAQENIGRRSRLGFAGLGPQAHRDAAGLGYEEPTPIQREAIPPLLEGSDLVGQAATGTGKTAAFALPLLQRLAALGNETGRDRRRLMLVPTRELAMQVAEAVHRYGRRMGVRVLPIYGGQAYRASRFARCERGVDVVVATPGRALDHIRRGTLQLDAVTRVVLDEADEMLDMGFAEDIEAILAADAGRRGRRCCFRRRCRRGSPRSPSGICSDPVAITIAAERSRRARRRACGRRPTSCQRAHKLAALGRILDMENPTSAHRLLPHAHRSRRAGRDAATRHGYRAEALHGGMSQEQRDRVMKKLRDGDGRAGDRDRRGGARPRHRAADARDQLRRAVGARAYVHRIGRVGRAGREGVAITLAEPREHRLLRNIEQVTKQKIEIAQVPTVADLRARRLEVTRAACARRWSPATWTAFAWSSNRWPKSSTCMRSPWRP